MEAAHCRRGIPAHEMPGGTGIKPHDKWAIPLCPSHHRLQHDIGEKRFEDKFQIDMKATARVLWQRSPHRHKHEEKWS